MADQPPPSYVRSLGAFIAKWHFSLPPATAFIILVCVALQIANIATGWVLGGTMCLAPVQLILHPITNALRPFTSIFIHPSGLYLIFNLLFFAPCGKLLEGQQGTLGALQAIIQIGVVANWIYTLMLGLPGLVLSPIGSECRAGLNAVMYALMTVEANRGALIQTRRIFGVPLPGAIYPYLLLILTFLIFGSPFFVNLSGILCGVLYIHTSELSYISIPKDAFSYIEASSLGAVLHRIPRWVGVPGALELPVHDAAGPGESQGLLGRVRGIFGRRDAGYTPVNG